MKELFVGFAVISVCIYICMLPWITLFRVCTVLAKIFHWLGLRFVWLGTFFFKKAWKFAKKHKAKSGKGKAKITEDEEQFGDSLEF